MALKIQFTFRNGNKQEVIVVDASVSETHSFAADITEFPVEKGANVSDNIRSKPAMLRIEAFISDAPLLNAGRTQTSSGGAAPRPSRIEGRSQDVLNKLIGVRDEGVLITVETGIQTYKNMLLQNIEMPRDKSLKGGIRLTLSFKEVRIVQTQQAVLEKPKEAKGHSKRKDGHQTGKGAKAAEVEQKSLLASATDSVTGFRSENGLKKLKKQLPGNLFGEPP